MFELKSSKSINLNWLIKLRWAAVIGQCLIVSAAVLLLHIELPLVPIASLICLAAVSNILLFWLELRFIRFDSSAVAGILILDTSMLAALLYWSGGSMNPFSTLFLVHITLAAVILGPVWTWLLALYATLCFVALFRFNVPLPSMAHDMGADHQLSLHLEGMLVAFILTAALIAYFLDKVTKQLQQLQLQKSKQTRLASLAALAAGAAHELGSPLATIAVANGELGHCLENDKLDADYCSEHVSLVSDAVIRCKTIIDQMGGKMVESKDNTSEELDLAATLEALKQDLEQAQTELLTLKLPEQTPIIVAPKEMLLTALREMIKNAFDASGNDSAVRLEVVPSKNNISFIVEDRGHGISQEDLPHIAEPFFTNKQPGKGMGLGCFIVDLCARSMEGDFSITALPERGAKAVLTIPIRNPEEGRKKYA